MRGNRLFILLGLVMGAGAAITYLLVAQLLPGSLSNMFAQLRNLLSVVDFAMFGL